MDKTTNYFLIFIGLVVLGVVLKELAFFLRPLILAIILTMLIAPSIKGIQKKRLPRIIKKNIVRGFLLILVLLSIFFFIQYTKGVQIDVDYYQNQVNGVIVEINDKLISRYNNDFNLLKVVDSKRTVEIMSSLIQGTIAFFSEMALALLFIILFLPSYNRIVDNLTKSSTVSKREKFKKTLEKVEEGMVRYLGGKTIISLGTAITTALALFIFGADYIFVLAVFVFILNFIPNIGSFIAVLIAVLFYFVQYGFVLNVLWLLIVLIIIQIVWGSLIDPHFIGHSLRLYPFVILASLFLWYWIWGPIGMLLAVPITSTIKIVLEHLGEKTRYVSKLLGD
jgi:predicted PurR-regulated permease PerM